VTASVTDHRVDVYDSAAALVRERSTSGVLSALAARTLHELDAAWVAVVDGEDHLVIASAGSPPPDVWVAVAAGGDSGRPADDETASVHLASWDLTLVVGRPTWPFGARDRGRLASLARLADARWVELSEHDVRLSHPTTAG